MKTHKSHSSFIGHQEQQEISTLNQILALLRMTVQQVQQKSNESTGSMMQKCAVTLVNVMLTIKEIFVRESVSYYDNDISFIHG